MLRLIFPLIFTSILVLVVVRNSYSDFRFSNGSEIEVQWYEKEGMILNEHVCFNYEEDEKKYKLCRKQAEVYFKDECKFFTDKVEHTQKKYKGMYIDEQEKFCNASQSYTP